MLKYEPPGGHLGTALTHWLGDDPDAQIEADLNELKRLMEAVEPPAEC